MFQYTISESKPSYIGHGGSPRFVDRRRKDCAEGLSNEGGFLGEGQSKDEDRRSCSRVVAHAGPSIRAYARA